MATHTNKKLSTTILILSLLFFSTFATACVPCTPTKKPPPVKPPTVKPPTVKPPTVKPPTVKPPTVKPPTVKPPTVKPPTVYPSCPKDTLKLGACVDVLGLVNVVIGGDPYAKCCTLLEGLSDLEAAACLCTVIKANALGLNLKVPVALSVLANACGKNLPSGYQCA
ncbi:putative lipid-binding protein AIR1 [Impatiens glandulifera]|uniref:putative lipid-binding protein AIR1 n=1 Tax=Impatiens glandulifera TaxID=253017 RepID=UPI001FB0A3DC|nr:putative lipid-binding protein AIR1 [Impatiens glandulifera]